jgi:hypothetical protein
MGWTYTLLSPSDLVDWVERKSLLADPDGLIDCLAGVEANGRACFHGLIWP